MLVVLKEIDAFNQEILRSDNKAQWIVSFYFLEMYMLS